MHTMDLKSIYKKVTVNKVTKDIKRNEKNYSIREKSGIKRDMGRKKWDKLKIKNKMIELNPTRVNPSDGNPD